MHTHTHSLSLSEAAGFTCDTEVAKLEISTQWYMAYRITSTMVSGTAGAGILSTVCAVLRSACQGAHDGTMLSGSSGRCGQPMPMRDQRPVPSALGTPGMAGPQNLLKASAVPQWPQTSIDCWVQAATAQGTWVRATVRRVGRATTLSHNEAGLTPWQITREHASVLSGWRRPGRASALRSHHEGLTVSRMEPWAQHPQAKCTRTGDQRTGTSAAQARPTGALYGISSRRPRKEGGWGVPINAPPPPPPRRKFGQLHVGTPGDQHEAQREHRQWPTRP